MKQLAKTTYLMIYAHVKEIVAFFAILLQIVDDTIVYGVNFVDNYGRLILWSLSMIFLLIKIYKILIKNNEKDN
jgi:hypothetical protein